MYIDERITLKEASESTVPPKNLFMGYLSFTTDSRDPDYFRIYVGQTSKGGRRILEHRTAFLSEHCDTLHYYISFLGRDHRESQFFTLWVLNGDGRDAWTRFRQNVLELLFCFLFQTLPRATLQPYFAVYMAEGEYEAMGLNILSPLFQDGNPSVAARNAAKKLLLCSKDAEIRSWPAYRRKMSHKYHGIHEQSVATFPIQQIATEHIEEAQSSLPFSVFPRETISDSVSNSAIESELKKIGQHGDRKSLRPFGTLNARIGFLIDGSCGLDDLSETTDHTAITLRPPKDILDCGFNATNVFITTFDFCPTSAFEIAVMNETNRAPIYHSRSLYNLISASSLHIIFIWGVSAKRCVLEMGYRQLQRFEIPLRNQIFIAYGSEMDRSPIFIQLPPVPPMGWPNTTSSAVALGDIIKFATQTARVASIQPYLIDGRLALRTILFYYCRDFQVDTDLLRFEELDVSLQTWIKKQGFRSDEDIISLACASGGSLVASMLMLYRHLHPMKDSTAQRANYPTDEPEASSEKRYRKQYPRGSAQRVMDLFYGLNGCRQSHGNTSLAEAEQEDTIDVLDSVDLEPEELQRRKFPLPTPDITSTGRVMDSEQKRRSPVMAPNSASSGPSYQRNDSLISILKWGREKNKHMITQQRQRLVTSSIVDIDQADTMNLGFGQVFSRQMTKTTNGESILTSDKSPQAKNNAERNKDISGHLSQDGSSTDQPTRHSRRNGNSHRQKIQMLRPKRERYNWRAEAECFQGKTYHICIPIERRVPSFSLAFQNITLPGQYRDIGDGKLEVEICRTSDLSRHKYCRAVDATEDDPAKALAIRITGWKSNGEKFSFWSQNGGQATVDRMNTLADIIIERVAAKVIRTRDRRYRNGLPMLPGAEET